MGKRNIINQHVKFFCITIRAQPKKSNRQLLVRQILLGVLLSIFCAGDRAQAVEAQPYYSGKTITMLISTSPGGATDVAGRLVMRHLGKYLPGQPSFIAQNMTGAGGIVAADYLSNIVKPDGLTLLAVNRANYLEQIIGRPEVKLDFRKLNWVGSFNRAPMMIVCRKDTPYASVAMRSAKIPARFGEGGTGSISFVFSSLVGEKLDFKVKHVTGYGSAREIDLGLGTGRGRLPCNIRHYPGAITLANLGATRLRFISSAAGAGEEPVIAANCADGLRARPASAKSMLNLMDIMVAYTDFDRPFATAPSVPRQTVELSRQGFVRMLGDANFVAEAKQLVDWDGTSYLTGAALQKHIEKTVTQPPEVINRIKQILKESE